MFLQNMVPLRYLCFLVLCCGTLANNCNSGGGKPTLCQTFQAILHLAGSSAIHSIIQNHWKTDCKFRKAVKYMKSPDFDVTLRIIDNSPSFRLLIREFQEAGVDTTDIDSITKIFQCLVMPLIMPLTGEMSRSSQPTIQSRSLDSLALELFTLIPQKEFTHFVKRQLSTNEQFAAFYDVIRDEDFRSRFLESLKNRDICPAIKKLRCHKIDLFKLAEYSLCLFQRGPEDD